MIQYIDNDKARTHLRFVEWQAVLRLVYDRDNIKMVNAFPDYAQLTYKWQEKYKTYIKRNPKKTKAVALHSIYISLLDNKLKNLDEFYIRLRKEVTHRRINRNQIQQECQSGKNYTSQSFDEKQNNYLSRKNKLVNLVLSVAVDVANTDCNHTKLREVAAVLVREYSEDQLPEKDLVTLKDRFVKKVNAMEKSITRAESLILRNSDKKLARDTFYLYGLFKLRCEIGDTWALSQTELAKETLGVGRPAALNAVDLLIKLKLIEIFEQDSHVNSGTMATIYRRIG